jgi:prophage regulatory protein
MNQQIKTDRILRMPETEAKTGIKKSLIYNLMKKGEFPKQVKLGKRARGHRESDIDSWIAKRSAA